ncbi:hypothetical protein HPB50_014061 [Hyalomma asiaticum]|uniref:Uncharacterized protein n=1 Tax=Hyalomma asiaticum TaxID=266040 RepID=A0ACB7S527_HYAAI|nr:hypothetical protein HPB50_014061 [Hyalomma asiaticum]
MATYYNGVRDDLVVCPYNGQHKVKRGRLDIHISKCRKNIPRCRLRPCAFNPGHNAPATTEGYRMHLATCPDRSATHLSTATGVDSPYDPVSAPVRANPFDHEPEERWDVDAGPAVDPCRPTVAPTFRTVQGMTPSERRRHYSSLRANGPPVIYVPAEHAQTPTVPAAQTLGKGDCADEEEQWDEAPELEPATLGPQPVQAGVQHVCTHGAQTESSSLWSSQPHYDQAEVSRPRGNQAQMTGHSWTAVQADQAEPCQPSCAPASRPRFDQATQYQTGHSIRAEAVAHGLCNEGWVGHFQCRSATKLCLHVLLAVTPPLLVWES